MMLSINKQKNSFYKNGHLNDTSISLFAEALINETRFSLIPKHVIKHVEECFICKKKLIDLYEILKNEVEIVEAIKLENNEKNL